MVAMKKRKALRLRSQYLLQRHIAGELSLSLNAHFLKILQQPNKIIAWEAKPLNYEPLGMFLTMATYIGSKTLTGLVWCRLNTQFLH